MRHLQTRSQFQALLRLPPVARTAHFALHCRWADAYREDQAMPADADEAGTPWPGKDEVVWLGAMAPKRWARRAVTRNAIRRQVYALVASGLDWPLPAGAYLVRLRAAFAVQQFPSATSAALRQAVRCELRQLFARCRDRQGATRAGAKDGEGARAESLGA